MPEKTSITKYRFIPYRKQDIVEMCLKEGGLSAQEKDFRQMYQMLTSIIHFEFHQIVETLKDSYAVIDPDADTRSFQKKQTLPVQEISKILSNLLKKANYEQISQKSLNTAMQEESVFRIQLDVDFNDYAEVLLFFRGVTRRKETITSFFGLVKKTITYTNYERVVVYTRMRDNDIQTSDTSLYKTGSSILKLFHNVPGSDLEMLFPNITIRMRTIDKLIIGIPALVSGFIVLTTKLGTSLVLLGALLGFWLGLSNEPVELNKTTTTVLLAGLLALLAYLWKQFNKFKNRKLRFMQTLTQNLYFKNLDNNLGVFHHLINDAEGEECKETLLAYYFLLIDGPKSETELDTQIETWLAEKWHCEVNFEIDDALSKLRELGLITEDNHSLSAVSLEKGIDLLRGRWDNYFVSSK